MLRDLNASIQQIAQAETVRQQTVDRVAAKKRGRVGGALLRWAEGEEGRRKEAEGKEGLNGEEQTTRMWRGGVLFYLQLRLGEAGELQRSMMSRRLEREVERSKSVLYKTKGGIPVDLMGDQEGMNGFGGDYGGGGKRGGGAGYGSKMGAVELEEERKRTETQLSPDQLQLFAKENDDLLKHYEETLDQVR